MDLLDAVRKTLGLRPKRESLPAPMPIEDQMLDSVNELTAWFYKKGWNRAKSMSVMLLLMQLEPFKNMDPTEMQVLVDCVEETAEEFVKKHGRGGQTNAAISGKH